MQIISQATRVARKEHTPQINENSTPAKPCEPSAPARDIHGKAVTGAVGPGLVYSETSGTPQHKFTIDTIRRRLTSLRRAVVTSARLHQTALEKQKARFKVAMLTLTYASSNEWNEKDISNLIRHIRQYLKRRGISFRYVWVMETTRAGVPHYHLLAWLPKGVTLPKPDKRGWWPHGHTKIEWARKAVGYIAKYASKANSQKSFPKQARAYGIGGLELQDRRERAQWMLPKYIREVTGDDVETITTARELGQTKRAKGGGWLTPFGEWFPSKYKIVCFNPLTLQIN